VTKPQGYLQAAEEQAFWLFAMWMPYCQTALLAGVSGMISFVLLTLLLLFVVTRCGAIASSVASCSKDMWVGWLRPVADRRQRWVSLHLQVVSAGPSLAASFQRPPPLLF